GQETLGGHVEAKTYRGEFAPSGRFMPQARVHVGGQSVNGGAVASGFLALANREHILRASLMREEAGDSSFGSGDIEPSEYIRQRYDLGYSQQRGPHSFSIDYARNETGDAGTAALPMDIQSVDSDLFNGRYAWDGDALRVQGTLGVNRIDHWMTNFHLRRPPQSAQGDDPMRFRQTFATGNTIDAALRVEHDTRHGLWRYGIDAHLAEHDARIGNPNVEAFRIDNFNDVQRDILGIYTEFNTGIGDRIDLLAGIRFNRVSMRAGEVSANLNPMNMAGGMPVMMNAMAATLAAQFNASDRSRQDQNIDWFVRASLDTRGDITWYLGAARKTRSPSYQERYLWLPMESTGGLADGRTYTGNPGLRPEVAHEVELGFDLTGDRWSLYPRAFYRSVDDFIQGAPATDPLVRRFAGMMGGMGAPDPLRFSNTQARFYGLDVETTLDITHRWRLRGTASVVRAERRDIDDDLYRIAPDNLMLALDYRQAGWTGTLEGVHYARQDRVSAIQGETATDSYSLLNASARWQLSRDLEFVVGVNNLLDKAYADHLAGYNRAFNPDLALLERLPGPARNVFARMTWQLR
ncbi:MAG: TonB-dependent receptor, partial [Chromatocurvus sp.]